MVSKWAYYFSSLLTLLVGVRSRGKAARLLLGRPHKPIEILLRNGCRFSVRSFMDLWIIKETCLDRDYEKDFTRIGEDWSIVDIGAGLGDFSVCMACGHPQRRIAAFEPFAESFQMLRENLQRNGIDNVQAFPFAVGALSGPMQLQTATGIAVQHSTASAGRVSTASLPVMGITLEEGFQKAGFTRCDLLKVDCEGGEFDIFFNTSSETLQRIDRIVMEYHDGCTPHTHDELADFLRNHGFSIRLRSNPVHRNLGFLTAVRNP